LHQTFHPQVSGLATAPAGDGKEGTQRRARHPCPTRGNTHYGAFDRSELYPFLRRINAYLVRWLRKKYRRLRGFKTAHAAWARLTTRCPRLFAHMCQLGMANRHCRHRQPVTGVGVGASALGLSRLGDRVVALGEYLEHVVVGAVEVAVDRCRRG